MLHALHAFCVTPARFLLHGMRQRLLRVLRMRHRATIYVWVSIAHDVNDACYAWDGAGLQMAMTFIYFDDDV